jgi:hypothetical protein
MTQSLQFEAPATDQRSLPCSCGGQARYLELRAKHLLSARGGRGGTESALLSL